jgi:mannose-6-phosphate isomerase-like protein (cupin superfamily)
MSTVVTPGSVSTHPVGTRPVSIADAEHYVWGDCCDGWHLLRNSALSVIQERVPPGATERRHRHDQARQFFYVLRGEAVIEVDGTRHALRAGQGLHVPPGASHQFRNESTDAVEFLVVSSPPSHGDRIDTPLGDLS